MGRMSNHGDVFFFFNDTATTEIYTLSLHDALPISTTLPGHKELRRKRRRPTPALPRAHARVLSTEAGARRGAAVAPDAVGADRKSTRLNSSHANISYAVFCLKKQHDHW